MIFDEFTFHIVQDQALSEDEAIKVSTGVKMPRLNAMITNKTRELLVSYGARQGPKTNKIDLSLVNVIVANDIDFAEYPEAEELMTIVVTPSWVSASVDIGKLMPYRPYSPDPKYFFSDVNVCATGIPTGDREALFGGVKALGGLWSNYLTRFTTHLIATSMDGEKCQIAASSDPPIKIVLPHWIDDCLKLRRRLDDSPYLLPEPPILRPGNPGGSPSGTPLLPELSYSFPGSGPEPLDVHGESLSGKSFVLGDDLAISSRLRDTLATMIRNSGGSVSVLLATADAYVGQYREGFQYSVAMKQKMFVGNLTWLYWMIAHNKWTSPYLRLLHFPMDHNGVPGMQDFVISVSNYLGDSRSYLESLALATGASFTRTLKSGTNTHLISACASGEKYEAARAWNIHVVNHLWLEESYARGQVQSITLPRYTHFPSGANLTEVIGRTKLDVTLLRKHIEDVKDPYDSDGSFDDLNPDNEVEHQEVRDDIEQWADARPSVLETYQKMWGANNQSQEDHSVDQFHSPVEDVTDSMPASSLKKPPGTLSEQEKGQTNHTLPSLSPPVHTSQDGNQRLALRESTPNRTVNFHSSSPSSSRSRSAKSKAASIIHMQIEDLNDFQKRKRSGGNILTGSPERRKSKSVSRETSGESVQALSEKSAKGPSIVTSTTTVLCTGLSPSLSSSEISKLTALGFEFATDPLHCQILVAPRILRTEKFLCALASAPTIVSPKYLEDCIAQSKVIDTKDYALQDDEGEKSFNISLKTTVARALKLRISAAKGDNNSLGKLGTPGALLKGLVLNITSGGARGGFDVIDRISQSNGSEPCVLLRSVKPKHYDQSSNKRLILIADPKQTQAIKYFKEYCASEKYKGYVYRSDWIIHSILRMKLEFSKEFAL